MSAVTTPIPTHPTSGPRPALVRAEFLKIVSTKMWLGLLVGVLIFVAIQVGATAFAPRGPEARIPELTTDIGMRNLFGGVGQATVFALIIGALGITQEFRHQTITSTFLASPHRSRVMVAKMLAHVLIGAFYGVVAVVGGFAVAFTALRFKDHAPVDYGVVAQIGVGVILVYALYAVLGVAVGTLVRNQIAAIVGLLVWAVFIESLAVLLLPSWGKWLPGGAAEGVRQVSGITDNAYLAPLPAALLLIAYAVAFALIAARTTLRRDVS